MPTFAEIAASLDKLSNELDIIFERVFTKENIVKAIIETIHKRLFYKGITGTGEELITDNVDTPGQVYSDFTILQKTGKRQPTNKVTLSDTGVFYNSFDVKAKNMVLEILADFTTGKKEHIYKNFMGLFASKTDFENAVTSLSETELLTIIKQYAHAQFLKEFDKILKAA